MKYRNEKHHTAFSKAVKRMEQKDKTLMAALYLLTADHRLWLASKPLAEQNGINMNAVRIKDCDRTPIPSSARQRICISEQSI